MTKAMQIHSKWKGKNIFPNCNFFKDLIKPLYSKLIYTKLYLEKKS